MGTPYKKVYIDETEEELMSLTRAEVTAHLNDKQIIFAEAYVRNFNVKLAAIKAGYCVNNLNSAHQYGSKLRGKPEIARYIAWLKCGINSKSQISVMDIIDQYMRIAFADITDFVEVIGNTVKLKAGATIDGQLVAAVKRGKDGISYELHDKMKALAKLDQYFDVMPADWKQKVEERKVELLAQRVEIERIKAGQNTDDEQDDGFIAALKSTAEEIWDDE